MLLLFSAISSSIDSLIIGINMKLAKTKIKKKDFIVIFSLTFLILLIYHFLFSLFHINLGNKWISVLIYIILGIIALFHKEEKEVKHLSSNLKAKELFLLVLSHCTDGFIISITFLNQYSFPFLCFIFAFSGILFTFIGYKLARDFKNSNLISAIIFFLLAIWSIF